jgi:hypothetical protein
MLVQEGLLDLSSFLTMDAVKQGVFFWACRKLHRLCNAEKPCLTFLTVRQDEKVVPS